MLNDHFAIRRFFTASLSVLVLATGICVAQQTSAFNYQGKLGDAGAPAPRGLLRQADVGGPNRHPPEVAPDGVADSGDDRRCR